jgi:CHASE2 domain-containing sensor protein
VLLQGTQMRRMTLQAVNTTSLDRRFKQSPLAQLIATMLFISLIIGAACWHSFGDFPLGIVILCGVFFGLLALISFLALKSHWLPPTGSCQLAQIRFWLSSDPI